MKDGAHRRLSVIKVKSIRSSNFHMLVFDRNEGREEGRREARKHGWNDRRKERSNFGMK